MSYPPTVVKKAASLVAETFYDLKTTMNLEMLKFPWNCSITSATMGDVAESSGDSSGADDKMIGEKFMQLLKKAVPGSGFELMKGLNSNMMKKKMHMNVLVHPLKLEVELMGQNSRRDMADMGKRVCFINVLASH